VKHTLRRYATVAFRFSVVALAVAPAAQAAEWRPDVSGARDYARERLGQISFAVRADGHLYGVDVRRTVPSASVVKAMLLVAYLRQPDVRDRPLRDADRDLLEPMIRWSDNVAATRVRDIVGNAGLVRLAHKVGMRAFAPAAIWGLSRIDAADQTLFFLHLDRYVPARHRATALRLLSSIVPSQRWGIGRVRPAGWALYFKGGWGSGSGAVDHQVALLRRGQRRVSVAILTTSSPSHDYGKQTLRGVAARLLRGLAVREAGSRSAWLRTTDQASRTTSSTRAFARRG
jgi:beta-lactamase class A